ncbi:hypothetical protein OS493_031701 [Desmophyllum pertusum]|uniref:Uncharacterized protein n=1 Tax=Desmophyllum pertusum TaxID=174260 RepID=A0A9W9ZJY8_9CNID|nr:hypothetical protein OS493_031701 [Desmophyllum pertusum]
MTGSHIFVEDIKTLRIKLATYYNLFALGTQLTSSGVRSVYSMLLEQENSLASTGTDINIEDLLSDITFFNQGQSTYAFMIMEKPRFENEHENVRCQASFYHEEEKRRKDGDWNFSLGCSLCSFPATGSTKLNSQIPDGYEFKKYHRIDLNHPEETLYSIWSICWLKLAPIKKDISPSTDQFIDLENQDPTERPPARLPELVEAIPELNYEDPDELHRSRLASEASIQWPYPYNEIQVQSRDNPPAVPPARKPVLLRQAKPSGIISS